MMVGKMRWEMMWEIAVLLMIILAVFLPVAEAYGMSDSAVVPGIGKSIFPPGSDAKKLQDKIAGALASLKTIGGSSAAESGKAESGSVESGSANTTGSMETEKSDSRAGRNETVQANNSSSEGDIGINVNGSTDEGLNGTGANQLQGSRDAGLSSINVSSLDMSGAAGQQGLAANTTGSFKGFYGMTASRHEIGKSGIDSSMFLSGSFSMDKSVKFQDQGI